MKHLHLQKYQCKLPHRSKPDTRLSSTTFLFAIPLIREAFQNSTTHMNSNKLFHASFWLTLISKPQHIYSKLITDQDLVDLSPRPVTKYTNRAGEPITWLWDRIQTHTWTLAFTSFNQFFNSRHLTHQHSPELKNSLSHDIFETSFYAITLKSLLFGSSHCTTNHVFIFVWRRDELRTICERTAGLKTP